MYTDIEPLTIASDIYNSEGLLILPAQGHEFISRGALGAEAPPPIFVMRQARKP